MKIYLPLLLLALTISACNECPNNPTVEEEIDALEILLERYTIAMENEDFSMIENIWATNDSIILLGTDMNEKLMGWENIREAYRNQFDQISEIYISTNDQFIRINCTGNSAWFIKNMNYNFMYDSIARSYEGIRFSGVFDKNADGHWKMVQGHVSVPAQVNIRN
ncbi:MAG: nuclear transport factor 2 family protein [Bacteroidetes bacterium]|jgi:ketosteroid isomerase-like protein|nr:nuclear transport factor 2 family protein [Bacteroidota bacterium]MDA3944886.1 nuclear transport factor 2 family protein [Bacteroidota bacterium]